MTNIESAATQPVPPAAVIMQFATGGFVAQALWCATKLNIADLLASGPRSTDELASESGSDAASLYRVLRALASVGIFSEVENRVFTNTPVSDTLRDDSPMSQKAMVLMISDPEHVKVIADMIHSVRTGEPAWEHVHGVPVFEYFYETNKEAGDVFNQAMTAFSRQTIPAILASYDFPETGTIADIAGGVGHLLGAVLQKYSSARGILFEIPPVLASAPQMLASYGVAERTELVAGDFVESIPVEADIYILKHIIHDWYDDKCKAILGNIRESMPDSARVLLIDAVIPPGNFPHPGKVLDLEMLISPGGKERTESEFDALLAASGFKMTRIVPTPSPVSIVEAEKA